MVLNIDVIRAKEYAELKLSVWKYTDAIKSGRHKKPLSCADTREWVT